MLTRQIKQTTVSMHIWGNNVEWNKINNITLEQWKCILQTIWPQLPGLGGVVIYNHWVLPLYAQAAFGLIQ